MDWGWLFPLPLFLRCGSMTFLAQSFLLQCTFTPFLVLDCSKALTKAVSPMNSRSAALKWPARSGCRWYSTGRRSSLDTGLIWSLKNLVIVEVKSVEAIHPVHQAQLLSYMRLSGIGVGLLSQFLRDSPARRNQTHGRWEELGKITRPKKSLTQ